MISTLYIILCVIHLLYWVSFYFAFKIYKPPASNKVLPPVSIIVCFKNEEKNILKLLDFLCNQDYPNYEIILVDDYSEDSTVDFIAAYADPKIKLIKAEKNIPGKKAALETGIKVAKNKVIVLTDADCEGKNSWLKHLASVIPDNGCVLGYAPIYPSDSLVSIFASYESWITGVQYISYAIHGNPYMGVGRNMAYYKGVYWKSGGYKKHGDIISGDDDLLVNAAASKANTVVQLHPDSFIYSEPPKSIKQFLNQKSRHLKTSTRYKLKDQLLLSLFAATLILIYIGLFFALKMGTPLFQGVVYCFIITMVIKYLLSLTMIKTLKSPFLKIFYPLMDALLFIYYLIMIPMLLFKKDETWK